MTPRWLLRVAPIRAVGLSMLCLAAASAQQAIINVPSPDAVRRGEFMMVHESSWRPFSSGSHDYWYGTNFLMAGIGYNTELAVTSYNTGYPSAENHSLGVGFKTVLPAGPHEQRITFGSMAITPFENHGRKVGNFSYAHYSVRVPGWQTRITAGGFGGTEHLLVHQKAGFLGAVEHPLNRRVGLLAEWFSGAHEFGAFSFGTVYYPAPGHMLLAAWKTPNHRADFGRPGFVLEYGFTFGSPKEKAGESH